MKTISPYLLLALVFLICCSKENEEVLEVPQTNIWTEKANFSGGDLSNAVSFVIDDKWFVGTGIHNTFVNYFYVFNYEVNSWKPIASLPSNPRSDAIAFSIGKYGYVGLGLNCIGSGFCTHYYYNDLWRYSPENDSWTKMADFPGTPRANSTCFVINDKAYVTGGSSYGDNDLWEYNSITNTWTKKANYPGGCTSRGVSFSLNSKGYVGFGWKDGTCNDFWEYDPLTDMWKEKQNFPGEARHSALAFSFMGKAYLASGINQGFTSHNYLTDFWKYDYINDTWIEINTDYPGEGRVDMIADAIQNKIFMGLGANNIGGGPGNRFDDIWEYTPE